MMETGEFNSADRPAGGYRLKKGPADARSKRAETARRLILPPPRRDRALARREGGKGPFAPTFATLRSSR
jgi:hypothetical protein